MTKTAMEMITAAKAEVGAVSPKDAAAELASGKAVLLDVREAEEWRHGHIDGSVPCAPRIGRVLR
jgi:rhodanese-related sulfurtransferase